MNIIEQGYNSGWTNMNQTIHGAFDKVKNYMNYADINNQIKGIQNPYNYQVNICNMAEMERLKFELGEKQNCYIREILTGNKKEAQKCFKEAKKIATKYIKQGKIGHKKYGIKPIINLIQKITN